MKVINLDNIRPANYEANAARNGYMDTCLICGRKLKPTDKNMVHYLPNGDITDEQLDFIPACEELGWWEVGNTCYKTFQRLAHSVTVMEWKTANGY